jgi:hypothetical protein
MRWRSGTDAEINNLREKLREHVKALAVDIGPRAPSVGNSLTRAANYIRSVFEGEGLLVSEQSYQYFGQRVANVLATLPETGHACGYYIVGAHYDTVPDTPGADDNASAVAVLLELAARIRRTRLMPPVLFAAFTLEEPPAYFTGHQGSRMFVRDCLARGDIPLGAIILEMVGYTAPLQRYPYLHRWPGYPAEGDFIGIIANWRSLRFGWAVLRGFRQNQALPVRSLFLPFNGWLLPETRLSDHASFWDAGQPALMVTDTAFFRNPNYHLRAIPLRLWISPSWPSSSKASKWRSLFFQVPRACRARAKAKNTRYFSARTARYSEINDDPTSYVTGKDFGRQRWHVVQCCARCHAVELRQLEVSCQTTPCLFPFPTGCPHRVHARKRHIAQNERHDRGRQV